MEAAGGSLIADLMDLEAAPLVEAAPLIEVAKRRRLRYKVAPP